jgi:hypothetical protein
MILVDNRNILRLKDRDLLNRLSLLDEREPTGNVIVEQAKTGVPTIKISLDGRTQYLQSKYDPEREAERFAGKFDDESIKHVLFVGVGVGYHIQKFMKAHPDAKFSIYEPNEEVLHAYLSNFHLDHLPVRNLVKIIVGTDQENVENEVHQLLVASNNILKIITLPVYENIYGEYIGAVLEKALESLKDKHNSIVTNISFQKRWTINSIKNFPTVLGTPNILRDVDRSAFEGKPAIIVAAGPSLNEEFENLRYIKQHGLAYIFSVGSAINALIDQGIYPDAACTYDPKEGNKVVFEKIKQKEIKNIPLIFGSSVGYETLEDYPGKMLHMITSQDTISTNYLQCSREIDVVFDAPSIAVVTFQMLAMLKCNPIILVGQNLSYPDSYRYAKGINYSHAKEKLTVQEQKVLISIKDVNGKMVYSDEVMLRMRDQLEMYIKHNPTIKVINTTKGGASIEGASFIELDKLLDSFKNNTVVNNWYRFDGMYSLLYSMQQAENMEIAKKDLGKELQKAMQNLHSMQKVAKSNQTSGIEKRFNRLDDVINKINSNSYYQVFINPMLRVQREQLTEGIRTVKFTRDIRTKATQIVHLFGGYLSECQAHYQAITPYIDEMHEKIRQLSFKCEKHNVNNK